MQDDAHIFVTEEQIEEEYARILEITRIYYGIFNLEYSLRLGTRPADFMGDAETWDLAEAALLRILEANAGIPFTVEAGEGAFYGPKIDILMKDAIGRSTPRGRRAPRSPSTASSTDPWSASSASSSSISRASCRSGWPRSRWRWSRSRTTSRR
jgi:hypothetical protein